MDPQTHENKTTKAQFKEDLGSFSLAPEEIQRHTVANDNYRRFAGKTPAHEEIFSTRDLLDERNGISLDTRALPQRLVRNLIDLPLVQRLRDIYQMGGAYFVYKEAGHRRFDHALGSGCLGLQALESMRHHASRQALAQIDLYELAVVAASLLHDIGHIAPRSHMAEGIWFPKAKHAHEDITRRLLEADQGLRYFLNNFDPKQPNLHELVLKVLQQDATLPAWTWKLVTGGGWNIDRGDWMYRDSVHCGVNYGKWDITPLLKKLCISNEGELCIAPADVPLIEGFFKRRAEMYTFVYNHPVARTVQAMHERLIVRARALQKEGGLECADETMKFLLKARHPREVPAFNLLMATDSWWQAHVTNWMQSEDPVLSDLSKRLTFRKLFNHFPDDKYHRRLLGKLIQEAGLDPKYYLLKLPKVPSKHQKDLDCGIKVLGPDGTSEPLAKHSPELTALGLTEYHGAKALLAIPKEPFYFLKAD